MLHKLIIFLRSDIFIDCRKLLENFSKIIIDNTSNNSIKVLSVSLTIDILLAFKNHPIFIHMFNKCRNSRCR